MLRYLAWSLPSVEVTGEQARRQEQIRGNIQQMESGRARGPKKATECGLATGESRDRTMGKVFALHVAGLVLNSGTP